MYAPSPIPPGDPATRLDTDRRSRSLDRLRSSAPLDLLVVGGGITGVGVALDAASRGLDVALVERHDLAFGTSRWSSKLVHGGLRYLVKGDLGIAWESAVERATIADRIAPHLIRQMAQVVPIYEGETGQGILARISFLAADILRVVARTRRGTLDHAEFVGSQEAVAMVPALRTDRLRGAVVGHDLQLEDDARLVVALARTAAAFGAHILTGLEALELGPTSRLRDTETDDVVTVRARHVVNATGVWAGMLDESIRLQPSLGTHVVVRSERLGDSQASLTVPVPGHFGRFVFTLPQPDGLTYIGLTDTATGNCIPDVPEPPEEDIEWILDVVSQSLDTPLDRSDVVGSFAGLRPLIAPEGWSDPATAGPDLGGLSETTEDESPAAGGGQSADLSRRHALVRNDNVITVTGGKLTSYRRMAQDVVDTITDRPCRTAVISAVGAGPASEVADLPQRLVRRYGSEAALVWSLGDAHPWLRDPVAPGSPVLGVELAFGVVWEGARSVGDLLDRRTRIGLVPADRSAAEPTAERVLRTFAAGRTMDSRVTTPAVTAG